MIFRDKITAFIPYIRTRVLCFLAHIRNKKMQHAENQHVARFVSCFETFRIRNNFSFHQKYPLLVCYSNLLVPLIESHLRVREAGYR